MKSGASSSCLERQITTTANGNAMQNPILNKSQAVDTQAVDTKQADKQVQADNQLIDGRSPDNQLIDNQRIDSLLNQAKLQEGNGDFEGASKLYRSAREALWPGVDSGEIYDTELAVQSVIGEFVCELASCTIHSDILLRGTAEYDILVDEMKERLNEVCGKGKPFHNLGQYYNSLITGFKKAERLMRDTGWETEAGDFYVRAREAERGLTRLRMHDKLRARRFGRAFQEARRLFMLNFLKVTCGYGERPWQWILSTMIPILAGALILCATQWISWSSPSVAGDDVPISASLYYAVTVFLTSSQGDIAPNCLAGRITVIALAGWGYVMFGVLV